MSATGLPTFLVIGAAHCGTTTLCATLGNHPDIFMSVPKEIGYFCHDRLYAKGEDWYRGFFQRATHHRMIGEGSTSYSKRHLNSKTAERIARDLPDVRLLYLTRHPLEQMASSWRYSFALGEEYRPFSRAIQDDPSYLLGCDYAYQMGAFADLFPRERILVLFLEDMKSDCKAFMERIFDFLELPSPERIEKLRLNVGDNLQAPSPTAKFVQHIPGIYRWGSFIPRSFREPVARLLFSERRGGKPLVPWNNGKTRSARPVPKPSWEPSSTEKILDEVEERAARFLKASVKPADFWDFRPYREHNKHPLKGNRDAA